MTLRPLVHKYRKLLYAPVVVQLVILRGCNLSCAYCNEYEKEIAPVPVTTLKRRMDKLRALGARTITLTGGEPTLHPRLPELIQYARRIGFFSVSLISNGFRLKEKYIHLLNAAGLNEMQISLDGVMENRTTRKVLDNSKRQLQALREHAHFKVAVSAVLGACSIAEVEQIINHTKYLSFDPRLLLMHDSRGQCSIPMEKRSHYKYLLGQLPLTIRDVTRYKEKLITQGTAPFKCRAGSRYLYVDEYGMVAMCSQTRDKWSKPLLFYTVDDLEDRFYAAKNCNSQCTLGCVRSCSQFENWRGQKQLPLRMNRLF